MISSPYNSTQPLLKLRGGEGGDTEQDQLVKRGWSEEGLCSASWSALIST